MTGPTTALLASLRRLGWSMSSASEVFDDQGTAWSFRMDSPAAIVTACKDSVRRWRLVKIGRAMPSLVPTHCEVPALGGQQGTVLVDLMNVVGPLVTGKGVAGKASE